MKMIYVADDGKEFTDATECRIHEEKILEEEKEARKKKEEQEQRFQELKDAWQAYMDLKEQYYKDYSSNYSYNSSLSKLLNTFFA